MKPKELILREINDIAHHDTKLYAYLYLPAAASVPGLWPACKSADAF
jgi:hypothetical protein